MTARLRRWGFFAGWGRLMGLLWSFVISAACQVAIGGRYQRPGRSFSAGTKKPPEGGLMVLTAWRLLLNPAGGNLLDRGFDGVGIKRDYFVTGLFVEHFKVGHQRQNLIAPECLGSLLN